MNVSVRFVVLLVATILVFVIAGLVFHEHVVFAALGLKALFLKFKSQLISRAFWEAVPLFIGKWSMKAAAKFLFVTVPMIFLAPVFWMFALESSTRKKITRRLQKLKDRALAVVYFVLRRFESMFGVNGTISFILSGLAACLMFLVTYKYLAGWGFFVWLGSWGPLAPVWAANSSLVSMVSAWVVAGFTWFINGLFYRLPALSRLLAYLGELWVNRIASKLPEVEVHRRKLRYRSLRAAHTGRKRRVLAFYRMQRQQQIRKKKRLEKREDRLIKKHMRFLWTSAARPLWERRFWHPYALHELKQAAPRESSERLHLRGYLGADVHQGLLHGGHSHWRVVRR